MIKKTLSLILTFAVLGTLYLPQQTVEAFEALEPYVTARSLVIYDPIAGRILASKNTHDRLPLASTTKVMTAIVVMKHLSLDKVITVRQETAYVPRTKIYIRPGEMFRVKDLLRALLISSSNDVAVELAYQVAGSEREFAKLMNQKARQIGARDTHFVNPHGLPADGHYSTSYDLALIMNEAKKYPFIMRTLAIKRTSIHSIQGRRFHLKNHNKMLWRDRRPVIGKTGFTRGARHCFVGRINYRKRDVLVAIMGSVRPWHDLKVLLDFYSRLSLTKQNGQITENNKWWERRRLLGFEKALKQAGLNPGPVDGIVTRETVKAIRHFQKKNKLPQTGTLGPQTSQQLKKLT